MKKLLPVILEQAAAFFNCYENFGDNPHFAANWRALELASLLIGAEDIVDQDTPPPQGEYYAHTNDIIALLQCIAGMVTEIADLKPDTRKRLEYIWNEDVPVLGAPAA
jgi:hypothetical protein